MVYVRLACKQALLFEHQRSEPRENARASGEAARGFSRASTFHRRVFNNYSSSPNGLGVNSALFAPQILHKPLFLITPGNIAFSQEHFKTISYAKFGGQTECIMGNWKIVNGY